MSVTVNTIKVVDALVTDDYRGDKGKDYLSFVQPGNQQFKLGMPSDQVKMLAFGDRVSFEAEVVLKTGKDGLYMQLDKVKLQNGGQKQKSV